MFSHLEPSEKQLKSQIEESSLSSVDLLGQHQGIIKDTPEVKWDTLTLLLLLSLLDLKISFRPPYI